MASLAPPFVAMPPSLSPGRAPPPSTAQGSQSQSQSQKSQGQHGTDLARRWAAPPMAKATPRACARLGKQGAAQGGLAGGSAQGHRQGRRTPGRSHTHTARASLETVQPRAATAAEGTRAVRRVEIYDTTLRDGSQMVGISLSVLDKLRIADLLRELGVSYIEGGWPGSNPKDAEFFETYKRREDQGGSQTQQGGVKTLKHQEGDVRLEPGSRGQLAGASAQLGGGGAGAQAEGEGEAGAAGEGTRVAAFGSTRYKNTTCEEDANVSSLLASGAPVVTLVAKAWDAQVERVLEAPLEENLAMIRETVLFFKERGREVMLDAEHFFDGFGANQEYSLACVRAAAEAGVDVVVLCDTNGGSMPWQVNDATRRVVAELRGSWPRVRVGIHTHNDCDMAVANSVAAVEGGASLVQGCVNGYGERTGNANILSVIGILQVKLGYLCVPPACLPRLTAISAEVADITGQPQAPSQPFVGANAFAHKGGIHVAALRKMPESYNHCDPSVVGNAMRSVVSDLSGRGNILDKAEKAGLLLGRDDAGAVLAHIKHLESEGCAFESASASVDMLIVRRGAAYVHPFQVLEFSVISSNRGGVPLVHRHPAAAGPGPGAGAGASGGASSGDVDWVEGGEVNSQAIVKIRVGGRDQMSAAEGNGPVDALSHALRGALGAHYPQLDPVQLVDYRVRLVEPFGSGCGTMSTTRVTIDFADQDGNTWTTVGAHTSIVEASFRALVDGLEFGITNCSETGCNIGAR